MLLKNANGDILILHLRGRRNNYVGFLFNDDDIDDGDDVKDEDDDDDENVDDNDDDDYCGENDNDDDDDSEVEETIM